MKFNLLGGFAAGLFIATSISGAVYFSSKNEAANTPAKVVKTQTKTSGLPSEEEMKNKLVSAGYIVQTKAEYDKNIADAKAQTQKNTSSKNNDSKIVYRAVVNVSKGMTSIDVGKQLVKAKLIKNAFKFSKIVEKKGVENHLRPGSYAVDSSMNYDQLIAAIFK
ncbi:aminodeoxychorismate lyase [Heyndrickxia shackletonii]|uniref:Aminodeoxychorismate lyase n=1 Tax=Heyndrickxia shackletonii TaxID=157838 RepID=A0A0Q3WYC2_9BACI|nr:endolytic transglycosylase MltG [Heyndrickxia shackletonii]KQL53957.1 aminodeoxychorismate lyase [Heyndrickxia shackletonii]NEY97757.1 endolytic transglycosylase MltG [Heyndrickxia shackletonii]